ncbi:MAG TPA: hypothetical protein VII11_01785 [Bacteroidota bacterium]
MNSALIFRNIVLANVLDRARQYSFLVILGLTCLLSYEISTGGISIHFSGYQGLPNAAWVGTNAGVLTLMILCLVGFYVVNDSLGRDTLLRVRDIITVTSVSKGLFVGAKAASNVLLLCILLMIPGVVACGVFLGKGGSLSDLDTLLMPFAVLGLPLMIAIGSTALFLDSFPFLRSGLGNLLYCILSINLIARSNHTKGVSALDVIGLGFIKPSISRTVISQTGSSAAVFDVSFGKESIENFSWEGVVWSTEVLSSRLLLVGVAVLITMIGAACYACETTGTVNRRAWIQPPKIFREASARMLLAISRPVGSGIIPHVFLEWIRNLGGISQLLCEECNVLSKSLSTRWILGGAVLLVASFFMPFEMVRVNLYALSAVWFLVPLSVGSVREKIYRTEPFVSTSAHSAAYRITSKWLSFLLLFVLVNAGFLCRSVFHGRFDLAWIVVSAGMLITATALFLGSMTGGKKVFEIMFALFWYLGPVRGAVSVDFLGIHSPTAYPFALVFLATAFLLLASVVRLGYFK